MKAGIFGTGMVGRVLAEKFISGGDEVMIGTRNTEETLTRTGKDMLGNVPYKEWQDKNPNAKLGTFAEVAAWADFIILATHGEATANAIELAGKENFKGKVVIDMTNPLDASKGVPPAFTGVFGNSLGEQFQRQLPEANVVKAFNQMSVHIVVHPQREEGIPSMLIAGNSKEAKDFVTAILTKWGWQDVVDYGDITASFWLETLGMTWIYYAFTKNSWTHAFKLVRK